MTIATASHVPVLINPIMQALGGLQGKVVVDATFGAGGYSNRFLQAGAKHVVAFDRDPNVVPVAEKLAAKYPGQFLFFAGCFSEVDGLLSQANIDHVDVLAADLGVSSMQLDQADRGFSFMRDGPLDMRMGAQGLSAADLVNQLDEGDLANLIFQFGEERASRRIASAIVARRQEQAFSRTAELAGLVEQVVRSRPGHHGATRTFQALRIAVNREFDELAQLLVRSQHVLVSGGQLCVVAFHSLEDRMVKTFFKASAGEAGQASRYQPAPSVIPGSFEKFSKAIKADDEEVAMNMRARSAVLRMGTRTQHPPVVAATSEMDALRGRWRMAA